MQIAWAPSLLVMAVALSLFALPSRTVAQMPVAPAATPAAPAKPVAPASAPQSAVLDPSARLQAGDYASEYWTLFVELDSGHRITQRFLITNVGPGDHNAVAVGHLMEPGRAPFRYENGRRRGEWNLSSDRLFLDIAASHLDLHRPRGRLLITKDDIEIKLDFDFPGQGTAGRVPAAQLPSRYVVEVLAVGAATRGTLRAPWMAAPKGVQGRTWLVHTWTPDDEATLLDRRVDAFGSADGALFYALQVKGSGPFAGAWHLLARPGRGGGAIESALQFAGRWKDGAALLPGKAAPGYPIPASFQISGSRGSGVIHLSNEWLRFDPLDVIPQPFQWFVRTSTQPQEVWADTRIAVSIRRALEDPSLPPSSPTERVSNSQRETEDETADSSVTGVASITFMNPIDRR